MNAAASSQRPRAEFGFLRLLFATLVIAAHVPEQVDGDRHRELLSRFTGITFGELAVDSFFFISGYLITLSFFHSRDVFEFAIKRVIRVYPAFCAAYLICIVVIAPIGGRNVGVWFSDHWTQIPGHILLLQPPTSDGVFQGTPVPLLNAPMWTILFELYCYIAVSILGVTGILRHPRLVLAAAMTLLLIHAAHRAGLAYPSDVIFGTALLNPLIRLLGPFLTGACFFLFGNRIRLDARIALGAALLLAVCLLIPALNELGIAIGGGYLIFWSAYVAPPSLQGLNRRNDISYGCYLYAWPLAQLIVFGLGRPALGATLVADLGLSVAAGTASWFLVERPFIMLKPVSGMRANASPP